MLSICDRKIFAVANEFVYLKIGYLKAEIIRRDVFYKMSLVKDNGAVIGYYLAELVSAHVEIGEEKVVVDDDYVGVLGFCPHSRDKARLEFGTFLADTDVGFCVDAIPEAEIFRQIAQFAAVACLRLKGPATDLFEVADVVESVEDRLMFGLCDAIKTGVIRTAFHIRGRKFRRQDLLKERNIFVDKLFLQILCTGRNYDAFFFVQRGGNCGNQIRQGLTCSCPGLNDQMAFILKSVSYGFGHFDLPGTVFVVVVKF